MSTPRPESAGHYFDADPSAPSRPRTLQLALPDLTVDLVADAGVFSNQRIDPGTKVLLAEGPLLDAPVRHVLDLGCGYGPIAVTLARRHPDATVWAVDVNPRAVELCASNATAAALTNVRALTVTSEEPLAGVPRDLRFDAIWSNPPIRIGKGALRALLTEVLGRLAPDGTAALVVQRHLGADSLQRWLVDQGWPTERVASRAGYRLLVVRARHSAAAGAT